MRTCEATASYGGVGPENLTVARPRQGRVPLRSVSLCRSFTCTLGRTRLILDLIFTGEKCKAEMEKLAAELEKVAAEKDAAVAHQKELQDALDVANKQLKKEAIVIASKDEFIKTLIQTPAAA